MTNRPQHPGQFPSAAMSAEDALAFFEANRARLHGLVYRILGSRAEAEDVVQDTYLKWMDADHSGLEKPAAWLTSVATRRAIDILRSAQRQRTEYVGQWLPEPSITEFDDTLEEQAELASSLSTAFLHLLESLSPKERGAFLLHSIFEHSHGDVSSILGVTEAASRKLVSRAKAKVSRRDVRFRPPLPEQQHILSTFKQAIATGDTKNLARLLAADARLLADGGGKVAAVSEPVERSELLRFIANKLRLWWSDYTWRFTEMNGTLGILLFERDELRAAVTFGYNDLSEISDIQVMRNPDKLNQKAWSSLH